jgi:hypothetical protein
MRHTLAAVFAVLAFTAAASAQLDRYELGLRLRAYEERLGASTDQERTAASLRELDRAVQAFFRFDLAAVARAVDAADRRLLAAAPDAATAFARSLRLSTAARLCDPQAGPVAFTLAVAFPSDVACPEGLVLDVALDGDRAPRASVLCWGPASAGGDPRPGIDRAGAAGDGAVVGSAGAGGVPFAAGLGRGRRHRRRHRLVMAAEEP